MALHAHGLSVTPPAGWDVRIYRREPTEPGEQTFPVVHAATFALPEVRGDYGGGAVERMGPRDIFVALLEFGPSAVDTPLFSKTGRPGQLATAQFSPGRLQRTIAGQSGSQTFFTENGRSFCLYVVLGSHAARGALVPHAHALVHRMDISSGTSSSTAPSGTAPTTTPLG